MPIWAYAKKYGQVGYPDPELSYIFFLEVDLANVQEEGEGTYHQNTYWGFQRPLFVGRWVDGFGGKLESVPWGSALWDRECLWPGEATKRRDSLVNLSSCLLRKFSTSTLPIAIMQLIPEERPAGKAPLEKRKRIEARVSWGAVSVLSDIKLKCW